MKIGIMNNPFLNTYEEIRWIGENKFDFIDLTLEPVEAEPNQLDPEKIQDLLAKYKLPVIGHTCYYLPYAHLIPEISQVSVNVFRKYIYFLKKIGCKKISIHTDKRYPDEAKELVLNNHIRVLSLLSREVINENMELMFENTHSGLLYDWADIEKILNGVPSLLLHLDIGHAYVAGIRDFEKIIREYGSRIGHLHFSDNDGTYDQHLEIGSGKIPYYQIVKYLKKYLPDCTITLEVFDTNTQLQREAQLRSREKILNLWKEA